MTEEGPPQGLAKQLPGMTADASAAGMRDGMGGFDDTVRLDEGGARNATPWNEGA